MVNFQPLISFEVGPCTKVPGILGGTAYARGAEGRGCTARRALYNLGCSLTPLRVFSRLEK